MSIRYSSGSTTFLAALALAIAAAICVIDSAASTLPVYPDAGTALSFAHRTGFDIRVGVCGCCKDGGGYAEGENDDMRFRVHVARYDLYECGEA